MKSHPRRLSTTKVLPVGSKRVVHPRLGIRCWLIDGQLYRTRKDYLSQFDQRGDKLVKSATTVCRSNP